MRVGVAKALRDFADAERRFLKQHDGVGKALLHQPFARGKSVTAMKDAAEIIEAETGGLRQVARFEQLVRAGVFEEGGDGVLLRKCERAEFFR